MTVYAMKPVMRHMGTGTHSAICLKIEKQGYEISISCDGTTSILSRAEIVVFKDDENVTDQFVGIPSLCGDFDSLYEVMTKINAK